MTIDAIPLLADCVVLSCALWRVSRDVPTSGPYDRTEAERLLLDMPEDSSPSATHRAGATPANPCVAPESNATELGGGEIFVERAAENDNGGVGG